MQKIQKVQKAPEGFA